MLIANVGCAGPTKSRDAASASAMQPAPEVPHTVDAAVAPDTTKPILWDGTCDANPLAKGCM